MRFTRNVRPVKDKCFVIMPFGKKELADGTPFDWDSHYDLAIKPTVERTGMTCTRADEIYGTSALMERVWKGIQEAEVIVADLTGRSPNVLYEVGIAHVIGKRILIVTQTPDDVPADLADFVQIRYSIKGLDLLTFSFDLARNLQAAVNEPSAEMMLSPLIGAGIEKLSAKVVHIGPEFVVVETQDGRRGFLYTDDVSWTRRKVDLGKLFRIGQMLDGAYVVDTKGQPRYSLTAMEENPWSKLEQEYRIGIPFKGSVKTLAVGIGAFVGMRYGVDGLIPASQIPQGVDLVDGSEIEAVPVRIDSLLREVELRLVKKISEQPPGNLMTFRKGQRSGATVVRVDFARGFVLANLEAGATGLIPFAHMSDELKQRFEQRKLANGDTLICEVTLVDQLKRRLVLRDIPEGIEKTEDR